MQVKVATEARREVVAQIIDYAKELAGWTYETLQNAIGRTKSLDGSGENQLQSLYELVSAKGETDEVSFHDNVSRNLKRGPARVNNFETVGEII